MAQRKQELCPSVTSVETSGLIPQVAVIPFREETPGRVAVLLIRWTPDGPWGVPKGLVDPGMTPQQAAQMEALEEGGVEGKLLESPIGEFQYEKFGGVCRVLVYAMRVTAIRDQYPEMRLRQRQWFDIDRAAELVERPALRRLIPSIMALRMSV